VNREVSFYGAYGLKLAGVLTLPDGGDAPHPGVVLCQGFGSTKEINLPAIAERLAAAGIASLAFDYRGWGASEGTKWRLIPAEQVNDIRAGLSYMETVEEVDADRLGLVGVSTGGSNALVVAGADSRAKATVAAVPFADGERWMRDQRRFWEFRRLRDKVAEDRCRRAATGEAEQIDPGEILVRDPESAAWAAEMVKQFPARVFKLTWETGEHFLEFRPERSVPAITPRALLLVAAGADAIVDPEDCTRMYEMAGEPKELMVLPGVEHHAIYRDEPLEQWTQRAAAFLNTHLG
jgi:alpha-beta hydrolase superfamily lysophospholipase